VRNKSVQESTPTAPYIKNARRPARTSCLDVMVELAALRARKVFVAFEERTRIDKIGSDPEAEEFVAEIIVRFDRFLRRTRSGCCR
jgi:hypothetical protein